MTAKSHAVFTTAVSTPIIVGVLTYFSLKLNPMEAFFLFKLMLVSTYMPDIDKAGSRVSNMFPFLSFMQRFEHRGPTHKFYAPIIYGVILAGLTLVINEYVLVSYTLDIYKIVFFGVLGYFMHLFADSFTTYGIPRFLGFIGFYSLPKVLRFDSGSREENMFVITLLVLFFIYLNHFKENILSLVAF